MSHQNLSIAELRNGERFDYYYNQKEGVIEVVDAFEDKLYRLPVDEDEIRLCINGGKFNTYNDGWDYSLQEPTERKVYYTGVELERDDYKTYAVENSERWGQGESL